MLLTGTSLAYLNWISGIENNSFFHVINSLTVAYSFFHVKQKYEMVSYSYYLLCIHFFEDHHSKINFVLKVWTVNLGTALGKSPPWGHGDGLWYVVAVSQYFSICH